MLSVLLTLTTSAMAETYTNSFIANVFAEKDQERGVASNAERKQQLLEMTQRTTKQCHNNLAKGQEAENIGNMIVATRQKLDAADITITHYELLDVVYSILGDGKTNWNCSSVLAMYMVLRMPADGNRGLTHLAAYKTVQAGRDSGLLGQAN